MNRELARRGLIFVGTIYVHYNNICILGLCEPPKEHQELVCADRASMIFTVAVALALMDAELWPRRRPFRPMPHNLIFCLELAMTLTISNLMLRLVWLPFVHIALQYINCTISDIILKLNSYVFPRGKNNSFANFASSACSPDGVDISALFVALFILARVIYTLYGERLWCIYNALLRCTCARTLPTPAEDLLSRRRSKVRACPSKTGRRGNVDHCEQSLPVMRVENRMQLSGIPGAENKVRRSLRLLDQGHSEPLVNSYLNSIVNEAQE